MMLMHDVDPIRLEVLKNRLASLTEEMGAVLMRTAFSPNIKERRDFSCALFNGAGEMVAQAAHIPVHLGSMPLSVAAAMQRDDLQPGDVIMLNDPYQGGTHLPDVTLVTPVFAGKERPQFLLANRAHHADIGGMAAGSLPLSTEIFQEGLRLPPVKLVKAGVLDKDLLQVLLANVRTPLEREGDLTAQLAANRTGVRRLEGLLSETPLEEMQSYCAALLAYGERMMRAVIEAVPDGDYSFSDQLEDDGYGHGPLTIDCQLTIEGGEARVDLSRTVDQTAGCLNAVRAITLSAVGYVFRLLASDQMPNNAGCVRPLKLITRPGSLVDCTFPAAVAGGNVETSQRIVDVLLGALAQALPEKIPAASCGTMNNLTIGGVDPRTGQLFTYYETIAGGAGGGPLREGASGLQTHMTNTLNTPVEALEHAYPLRVKSYQLHRGSGGRGLHRGGDGVSKQIELLAEARVSLLTERRSLAPFGLQGGEAGHPGENALVENKAKRALPAKFSGLVQAGSELLIETPGGGGWGRKK